jgi:hypothetical protein
VENALLAPHIVGGALIATCLLAVSSWAGTLR